jgi:hypothetical protein
VRCKSALIVKGSGRIERANFQISKRTCRYGGKRDRCAGRRLERGADIAIGVEIVRHAQGEDSVLHPIGFVAAQAGQGIGDGALVDVVTIREVESE